MIEGLLLGLNTALSLQNLMMVVAGCLIGTIIGMLPGLGPMSIIAIMIPIAIKIGDPSAALILLAGVYYGAAPSEAATYAGGHVYVIGGANSAGQAAMRSGTLREVTALNSRMSNAVRSRRSMPRSPVGNRWPS